MLLLRCVVVGKAKVTKLVCLEVAREDADQKCRQLHGSCGLMLKLLCSEGKFFFLFIDLTSSQLDWDWDADCLLG